MSLVWLFWLRIDVALCACIWRLFGKNNGMSAEIFLKLTAQVASGGKSVSSKLFRVLSQFEY